jgi:uncharacterized protein
MVAAAHAAPADPSSQARWLARLASPSRLVVPAVYRCRLTHSRLGGVRHSFRHTVYLWLTDVDDLPSLRWPLTRLARFDSRDHLGAPGRSLRANLDAFLAAHGIALAGGRALMLAQPRGLGYAFDPVTFFFCYDGQENPACVVAEVRNTFGERHCYLIRPGTDCDPVPKQLYVSPFYPADGHYRMRLALAGTELMAAITLYRPSRPHGQERPPGGTDVRPALTAVLEGRRVSAPASLAGSLLRPRRVLAAYRTIALIHWQAWRLRARGVTAARRRYHQPQAGVDAPPPPPPPVPPAPQTEAKEGES